MVAAVIAALIAAVLPALALGAITLASTVPMVREARAHASTIDERGYDTHAEEYASAAALSKLVPPKSRVAVLPRYLISLLASG